MKKIAIIGAGAAGCMAAVAAAERGADVVLFEKNEKIGKKLYITGKGRCNVTNDTDRDGFLAAMVSGGKFLMSAFGAFCPADTMRFFESNGVLLKVERGGRVFPQSDKSSDILKGLSRAIERAGVSLRLNSNVDVQKIELNEGFLVGGERFDGLIVTCGGLSYPSTGCNGDGYALAKRLGHKIIEPRAALVPIIVSQNVRQLQGLSLKNVRLTATVQGKRIFDEFGEMLFTDKGLSGPIALSLSSHLNRVDLEKAVIYLDLKPALSFDELDVRLCRDFQKFKGKQFKNCLADLLPRLMISYIIERSGVEPTKQIDHLTAKERNALGRLLKGLSFVPSSLDSIESGIVTAGGVCLDQINPKTMESKLVSGLYFAGECLDIDALTGGFNIQAAFSSGFLAGKSAAAKTNSEVDK